MCLLTVGQAQSESSNEQSQIKNETINHSIPKTLEEALMLDQIRMDSLNQSSTQEASNQTISIKTQLEVNVKNETDKLIPNPCLEAPCKFGEICEKSIDGFSYNCISESAFKKQMFSKRETPIEEIKDLFTNYPVDYYKQYLSNNPCFSSPCSSRQVCRNIMSSKGFYCVNELQAPNDIATMRAYYNGPEHIYKPSIRRDSNAILKKIQTLTTGLFLSFF